MFGGVGGIRREDVSAVGLTMTLWRHRAQTSHLQSSWNGSRQVDAAAAGLTMMH
jgi:hypothetical protein